MLWQIADGQIAPFRDFSRIRRRQAGQDFQQSRFSRAIASDHSDAVALLQRQRRVIKNHTLIDPNINISRSQNRSHRQMMMQRREVC